jgi:hypothetical protein
MNAHGPSSRSVASCTMPNLAANKITRPATTLSLPTTSSRSVTTITVTKPTARMKSGHAPRTRSMAQGYPAEVSISRPPIATSASPVSTLTRGVAASSPLPAPGIAGSCAGMLSSRTELDAASRPVGGRGSVETDSLGHDAKSRPSRPCSGSRRGPAPVDAAFVIVAPPNVNLRAGIPTAPILGEERCPGRRHTSTANQRTASQSPPGRRRGRGYPVPVAPVNPSLRCERPAVVRGAQRRPRTNRCGGRCGRAAHRTPCLPRVARRRSRPPDRSCGPRSARSGRRTRRSAPPES